jgi:hypothetical protein
MSKGDASFPARCGPIEGRAQSVDSAFESFVLCKTLHMRWYLRSSDQKPAICHTSGVRRPSLAWAEIGSPSQTHRREESKEGDGDVEVPAWQSGHAVWLPGRKTGRGEAIRCVRGGKGSRKVSRGRRSSVARGKGPRSPAQAEPGRGTRFKEALSSLEQAIRPRVSWCYVPNWRPFFRNVISIGCIDPIWHRERRCQSLLLQPPELPD